MVPVSSLKRISGRSNTVADTISPSAIDAAKQTGNQRLSHADELDGEVTSFLVGVEVMTRVATIAGGGARRRAAAVSKEEASIGGVLVLLARVGRGGVMRRVAATFPGSHPSSNGWRDATALR